MICIHTHDLDVIGSQAFSTMIVDKWICLVVNLVCDNVINYLAYLFLLLFLFIVKLIVYITVINFF